MRTRLIVLLALLVGLTGAALAQEPQAAQTQPPVQAQPATQPKPDALTSVPLGSIDMIDVSFRGASIDGDAGRFQRYQDIRDKGTGLNVKFNRFGPSWLVNLNAKNVGYDDQQFLGRFQNDRIKASALWNQTPLYYSNLTSSPYTQSIQSGVATLVLDQATRLNIQNNVPGYLGVRTSLTQGASSFTALANNVDLRSRRDNLDLSVAFAATKDVDVKFSVTSFAKTGLQPWGASFAFNEAVELPIPLDNRTTNFAAGAEWTNQQGMVRVGYETSYFTNNIQTLVWDNPVRATDTTGPTAYVTGQGSARGRMALWPSNHMNSVNAGGLLKLPARSALNASFSMASFQQNETLLPNTINSAIVSPPIPRTTAEGDVRVINTAINFSSRPHRYVGFTAKYRYYDKNNRTPLFEQDNNVRFDGVLEPIPTETEPVSIRRQSFNADLTFTPLPYSAFKVGYGRLNTDLTYRMFASTGEDTMRFSADTVGNAYVTLRAIYERGERTGNGFDADLVREAGQQATMRQFDVANRIRNRGTVILDVTPVPVLGFSASISTGRDEYQQLQFGLLNNNNSAYSIGFNVVPNDKVTFGANYGQERYTGAQASRTANPAPDPTWTDPNRNWNLDTTEKVRTYGANLDLIQLVPNVELRFGYNYSNSDAGYAYSGPWIAQLIALSQFANLPNVTNRLQHGTADVRYFFTSKVAAGFTYWYDQYDVNDFSTFNNAAGKPQIDALGGLYLGYGFRPYKANTGFFRVLYFF